MQIERQMRTKYCMTPLKLMLFKIGEKGSKTRSMHRKLNLNKLHFTTTPTKADSYRMCSVSSKSQVVFPKKYKLIWRGF